MLDTAINNLHKCLWVGILENLDESMEMFRYQSGLNVTIHHLNISRRKHFNLTEKEIVKLKMLMPMDVYIYEYAKELHRYRWNIFKNGSFDAQM